MKKVTNILCVISFALLAGTSIWAGTQIVRLHMLAPKFLYPVIGLLAAVNLLLGFFMLARCGKRERKAAGRAVAAVLALAISTSLVCGALAVGKVHETMDAITTEQEATAVLYVYVKKDSGIADMQELQTLGWTEAFDGENTKQALNLLKKEAERLPELRTYDSVPELVDALYQGEIDGLLLNSAYLGILQGMEGYTDFADQTTSIYSVSVKTQGTPAAALPEEEPDLSEHAFMIYLSGADTEEEGMTAGLSDVNILAAVNPNTRQVLLLNTPRDFFVPNPASGTGALDKLTHCGAYGVENSMQALSALYDEPIPYYARINFTGFEALIDAIGGVTVQSDYDFYAGNRHFVVGLNEVNGKDALTFARERSSFEAQDLQRGQNQMKMITAIIEKVSSARTLITNYADILESLQGMLLTNVPREVMEYLVRLQLEDMSPWHITTYAVNGTSDMQHTYSTGNYRAYVMWPNEAALEIAHALIDTVLAGEPITEDMLVLPEAPPLPEEET